MNKLGFSLATPSLSFSEKERHGKWFVMEEIDNSHPLLSIDAKICCVDAFHYGIKKGTVTRTIVKAEKDTDLLCFIRSEFEQTQDEFFKKIMQDFEWAFDLSKKIIDSSTALMKLSTSIRKTDVTKLSNEQLAEMVVNWAKLRKEAHGYGMPWNYVEYERGLLSNYLTSYIEKKASEKQLNLVPAKVFSLLSIPLQKTFAKKENEEILKLAVKIKKDEKLSYSFQHFPVEKILEKLSETPAFQREFNKHFEKYCWLSYMYLGPAWNKEYFLENLKILAQKTESELAEKLKIEEKHLSDVKREQIELMNQLEFDEFHRNLVSLAQSFLFTKAFRKDAIYYAFYCLEGSFKECAKRLGLSLKQFRMLMPWELKKTIATGIVDVQELNKRYNYRVFYYDGKTKRIISGEEARKFFESLEFEKLEVNSGNELRGECACPGKARGIVKIINLASEMDKMQKGNVLVSRATSPDLVPAMKLASAIVTDMGGITCHAAIVSRELKIPCVIGTKVATRVLKDGDIVEVDADKGIVAKVISCG